MTHDQMAYLALILVAFASYAGTLMWAMITTRNQPAPPTRASDYDQR